MKKIEPQKDRLLKEILQEISDEHHTRNPALIDSAIKPRTTKTTLARWIENIVIVLLVVLIVFMLFYPRSTTKPAQSQDSNRDATKVIKTNETKTENIPISKIELKEVLPKETINEKPVQIMLSEETKPNKKVKEVLKPEKIKSQREIAKEKLMEQLRK